MSRAVAQQFFADQYTPNATLVIVGDVTMASLLPRGAALGADGTPAILSLRSYRRQAHRRRQRETLQGRSRLAFVGIGFPAPAVSDPPGRPCGGRVGDPA